MLQEIMLSGPAGRVEARLFRSQEQNAPVALVLHPHPLHGGTMNNKVAYEAFHALARSGFSVLRFNFRGVGNSEGQYDAGVGELMDAAAMLDWLQLQFPDHGSCWVVGFSFGAWIALQLLMRRPELTGFVAISPPASSYDFSFLSPCPTHGLILQAASDTIALEPDVYSLYEKMSKQKSSDIEYQLLDGDHFFTGNHPALAQSIESYIKEKISSGVGDIYANRPARKDRKRRAA
jgi:alpha/beta superfamily hydrolase